VTAKPRYTVRPDGAATWHLGGIRVTLDLDLAQALVAHPDVKLCARRRAPATLRLDGRKMQAAHYIAGAQDGEAVEAINGKAHDLRRANLRIVPKATIDGM
jgi:hypothetical protein